MALWRWLTGPGTNTERYLGFVIAALVWFVVIVGLTALFPLGQFWPMLTILGVVALSAFYLGPIVRNARRKP